jgi:hypothetical protein
MLAITEGPTTILITGPGAELMAALRTRRGILASRYAAGLALAAARKRLARAQRPAPALDMSNPIDRAMAGFHAPAERASRLALEEAAVARCEAAVARREAELAAWDAKAGGVHE